MNPAVRDAALRWIADDIDAEDRAQLQRMLASALAGDADAAAELADRMAAPLRFGTAGLRGPLRAGPAGMNRAVVTRTTAGLAAWLHEQGRAGTVVVGRDARHGSEAFATDAAGVFAAAGFDTVMLPRALPTPVLAFAVRRLRAVAGVQVTGSHNPPGDNGYKVYLGADDAPGAQLAPPTDAAIEAAVAAAPAAVTVPTSAAWRTAGADLVEAYLQRVASLPHGDARRLRIAATPLHGVGGTVLLDALRRAGFTDVHLVASQAEPDPGFPTVTFPNPEETGATDELLALAGEVTADVAIALDPDADRFALGIPDGGRWRMLRGDETGVLLGDHVLAGLDRRAHPDPLVASTIVSSSLLRSVAAVHGVRHDETRTGFKWLVRSGDGAGTGLVYGYEEALGHCVDPDAVRDKDGISAAVLACDLTATARDDGRHVTDLLDALALSHGIHQTDAVSVWLPDHAAVAAAMAELRRRPPADLAGVPVAVEDLLGHEHQPDDTLTFRSDGLRVMVRPSGTEPKLKAYLEVIEPVHDGRLDDARRTAARRMGVLRDAVELRLRRL